MAWRSSSESILGGITKSGAGKDPRCSPGGIPREPENAGVFRVLSVRAARPVVTGLGRSQARLDDGWSGSGRSGPLAVLGSFRLSLGFSLHCGRTVTPTVDRVWTEGDATWRYGRGKPRFTSLPRARWRASSWRPAIDGAGIPAIAETTGSA